MLEGAQAGLSWSTILRKREGYRSAFAGFDPERVARFGERDVERLLGDAGIVRNRLKVDGGDRQRARLARRAGGARQLRRLSLGLRRRRPIVSRSRARRGARRDAESRAMSKDLKRRGFRFVGPTICYAFMQATGMVNDHVTSCFRFDRRARRPLARRFALVPGEPADRRDHDQRAALEPERLLELRRDRTEIAELQLLGERADARLVFDQLRRAEADD